MAKILVIVITTILVLLVVGVGLFLVFNQDEFPSQDCPPPTSVANDGEGRFCYSEGFWDGQRYVEVPYCETILEKDERVSKITNCQEFFL